MAITFNSCAHCNDCDDLVAEIDRRMNSNETSGDRGLQTRINDQIYGCQTPQDTINPHPACANHRMVGTWNGHNEAISAKWRNLQRGLEDFDNNDCGDKTSDPRTAEVMQQARGLIAKGRQGVRVQPGDYIGPASLSTGRLPSPIMPRVRPDLRGAPPIMNRPVIIPRRGSGGGGGWQFQLFQILPVL
jgi:hypothetical protein